MSEWVPFFVVAVIALTLFGAFLLGLIATAELMEELDE